MILYINASEIGEQVPGEHAFHAYHQIVPARGGCNIAMQETSPDAFGIFVVKSPFPTVDQAVRFCECIKI